MQNGDKASPNIISVGWSILVKNAHNYWTTWYIFIIFPLFLHFNMV